MSFTWGIEAIMSLIPIHLYLDKICGYQQLRMAFLLSNHMVKALLDHYHSNASHLYYFSLEKLSSKQRLKVKNSIVDINNHLNRILPSFNPLHKELMPGFQLVDIFFIVFHSTLWDTKCQILRWWTLNILFLFFIFFIFISFIFEGLRIRVGVNVMSFSHCHMIICHMEEHRRF